MVTAEDVMGSLEGTRVTIYLSAQTEEAENKIIQGLLRGYSENWVVIQESGDEEKPHEELTIVNNSSISILRKSKPYD
jgi:hypothetical protein